MYSYCTVKTIIGHADLPNVLFSVKTLALC